MITSDEIAPPINAFNLNQFHGQQEPPNMRSNSTELVRGGHVGISQVSNVSPVV